MKPITNRRFDDLRRYASLIGLTSLLMLPAFGGDGAPAILSLGSSDALEPGKAIEVIAVIQSAADIPVAHFEIVNSRDWQLVDGTRFWDGSLAKGEVKELHFHAAPLNDRPAPLKGLIRVPGYQVHAAYLDPRRLGGGVPERGIEREAAAEERAAQANVEDIRVKPEKTDAMPEPATAPWRPRLPLVNRQQPPAVRAAKDGTRKASVSVTATGRFTYLDDNDARRPVRFASVELYDRNPAPSFGDALCGKSMTDGDGNFSITGSCGDLFDGPDLFVRIVLNNNRIEVKPDSVFSGSYTFETTTRSNRAPGTTSFGTITIDQNVEAFAIHNLATRAQRFITDEGETMSKVVVNFPYDGGAHYNPFFDNLNIPFDRAFGQVGTVFHEYAHHILDTKAESPAPDYSEAHEDCEGSHCIDMPENLNVAWTEGFPNFYGALLHSQFKDTDGYPSSTKYACETMSIASEFGGREDEIEGVVCAILWDLVDSAIDDQGSSGAGKRDRINLSFANVWEVIKNYDPSTNLLHNHPTTIHEFWSGLRIFQLGNINLVSEAFAEHGIIKPQPNLEISALQNPPSTAQRGAQISIANTVRNSGNERANNGFNVRFRLTALSGINTTIGNRTIAANLMPGTGNGATTLLTIPSTLATGTYTLLACADTGSVVPERDETDNCRVSTTRINVN